METKAQRNERLKATDQWQAFLDRRDELLADGLKPRDADKRATAEFPPLPADERDEEADAEAAALAELVEAVGATKKSSTRAVTTWCFENYLVPFAAISAEDVPSAGALGMLVWLKANKSNYTDFLKNIWSKLLPTRQQLEQVDKFTDDGRKHFEHLDQLDESFADDHPDAQLVGEPAAPPLESLSENARTQLGLSATSAGIGLQQQAGG